MEFLRLIRRQLGRLINWFWLLPDGLTNWARQRLNLDGDWDRVSYLSDFERRLNRWLWALFWTALIYALFQHVYLANVPERFRGGARTGSVLYDMGIAYTLAFTFYLLNIRVPLRQDRRNIYRHLGPLVGMIVGDAMGLVTSLNLAAGVTPPNRQNTWPNVRETCSKIGPKSPTPDRMVVTATGLTPDTVLNLIVFRMNRTRIATREILGFSSYLASDLIDCLVAIETYSHFRSFDELVGMTQQMGGVVGNNDLSVWAKQIFDYLQLADDLDNYRHEFLPTTYEARPGLIGASERDSDEIPLRRYTDAGP